MKKLTAIVLVLSMILTLASGALAEPLVESTGAIEETQTEEMSITVGLTTLLSGCFFTDKWGANTSDIDIRELIHGHNPIAWEENGDYTLNQTVVAELGARQHSNGDKTYIIKLNEGLVYNDGTPITAYDYAFSVLLLSSPEFNALGGNPTDLDYLTGYEAYQQGQPFSGVRVIDDLTLELTINSAYLPYYYEITLLDVTPYPISVIAPGCEARDDGDGAYIRNIDPEITEPIFITELLAETILDEENGYLYKPYVSAGPYKFVSFDTETHEAKFEKNELYGGNFNGVKPTIDEITVVYTSTETALEKIENGELDLVNKITNGETIVKGMTMVGENKLSMQNYLRTGLSFISFSCEMGPTESLNVRKAIAYCVDVVAVNNEFTQGFGRPVYGYYGMGQWMPLEEGMQDTMGQYKKEVDLDAAISLLREDGWVLNEAGEAYVEGEDTARCRLNEDGELEKLSLNWAQPEETAMSDILAEQIAVNAEAVGIELIITKLPFDELLRHYYRQTDREYHMFSLATNFNLAFDPYYTYHTGEEYQGEQNKTGILDEALMNITLDMRSTEVGDDAAYLEKWLKFQDRWNELQPMIPLYSNVYFDFFRIDLQNYKANAYVSWATAIVFAYIGEPPADEIVEGPEGEDELDFMQNDENLNEEDELILLD